MTLFLLTLLIFSGLIGLMAIGLLAGRQPLRRGCGGFDGSGGLPCAGCRRWQCNNKRGNYPMNKESSNGN